MKTNKYNRLTSDIRERIVAMYQPGLSCTRIGKYFGISDTAVYRTLKQAGIKVVNRRAIWNPNRDEQLIRLCNEGKTPYQIADAMNLEISQLQNRVSILRHENQQRVINFSYSMKKDNEIL